MYEWICFFCLLLLYTPLLTLPKHKGENVHENPQQKITYCWARRNSTGGFGGCQSTKTTRPINSNMLNSNCKLTIAFTTSTSNKLVNKNVCTSMCTWSTSIKHLESRTMRWFWWISSATSFRTTKAIDQLQIKQSACTHLWSALILTKNSEIHRKEHKQSE